jgi:hypothetical protein
MLIMTVVFMATGERGPTTTIDACLDRRNGVQYNASLNIPNLRCRAGDTRRSWTEGAGQPGEPGKTDAVRTGVAVAR